MEQPTPSQVQQTAPQPKTKEQLRQEIIPKRDAISPADQDTKSTIVAMQLLGLPEFKDAKTIFAYASYGSELSTKYFIWKALLLGKKVCVPKVDFKTGEMWPAQIKSWESLKSNNFGIPEPGIFASKVGPKEVNLILVPAAVFDLNGHRIGSGKGFYDRYLTKNNHAAKTIGLAYDLQIVNEIPAEGHDVKVDKVITEKRIINCLG